MRLVGGWFAPLWVEGRFGGRFVGLRVGDGDLEFGIEVSFWRRGGGGSGLFRGEGDRDMWGGGSAAELGTWIDSGDRCGSGGGAVGCRGGRGREGALNCLILLTVAGALKASSSDGGWVGAGAGLGTLGGAGGG